MNVTSIYDVQTANASNEQSFNIVSATPTVEFFINKIELTFFILNPSDEIVSPDFTRFTMGGNFLIDKIPGVDSPFSSNGFSIGGSEKNKNLSINFGEPGIYIRPNSSLIFSVLCYNVVALAGDESLTSHVNIWYSYKK